ncbi:MAG: cation transporter [Bacteroidetes bacterium]|nr:cation transporter [Bacteroidota bacterium]
MKRWQIWPGLLVLLLFTGLACSKSDTAGSDLLVDEISTPGVQCSMCEATISAALKKIDGVKKVDVDLKKKMVLVAHTEGVTREMILNVVSASGYDADHVKKDEKSYENLPECCK